MDFDDLDDEEEQRVEDGEEVLGYIKLTNQPPPGEILPRITYTKQLPSFADLPSKIRKDFAPFNGKPERDRKPILRLLCAHGVADSYRQDWHTFVDQAPPEIEVAVHEFPGHGTREDEEILGDMDKLSDDCFEAFRECMDTGSFALFGHSIGCLIVTKVAMRARKELGVEPVAVFMVERGSCEHPKWTPLGEKVLREDKMEFMRCCMPRVYHLAKTGTQMGDRTMDMWQRGWFMENQTLEVGTHVYNCPLYAYAGGYMVENFITADKFREVMKDLDERKKHSWQHLFTRDEEGKTFSGHFPLWSFETWDQWTDDPTFELKVIPKCDHMGIKVSLEFRKMVWDTLLDIIKTWRQPLGKNRDTVEEKKSEEP